MGEYSYTSTHPLGHTGPVTGSLHLYYLSYNENLTKELLFAIEEEGIHISLFEDQVP